MLRMEAYLKAIYEWEYFRPLVVSGLAIAVSIPILKRFTSKRRVDLSQFPRDKVTLCQIPRGPWAPSLSPFPLKLETYLRMAKIPYQNQFGQTSSSKGKTPWMVCDGEEMADSQLCIEYLNRAKRVDLDARLSDQDRAIARAFRTLTEDHLYWALLICRWIYSVDNPDAKAFLEKAVGGRMMVSIVNKFASKQAYAQGMGRHTREEVEGFGQEDVRALSTFLGDKPFFMGAEPCELDCAVFGMIAQIYWHFPGTVYEQMVKGECSNLAAYCERMKERFWPDWDECITHGSTLEATK